MIRRYKENEIDKLADILKKDGVISVPPLFMTSANKSDEQECTNLDDIEKKCPLLDGMLEGNVVFGESSTIVDCSSEKVIILRNGPISMKQVIY